MYNYKDVFHLMLEKCKQMNIGLSKSQPQTPGDGNCFFHSLVDQLPDYNDHMTLRKDMILDIWNQIADERIFYMDEAEQDIMKWLSYMEREGSFADSTAVQACANLIGRDIIILPTKKKSCHHLGKYILIEAKPLKSVVPIVCAYFEDSHFFNPHYQSMTFLSTKNNEILKHWWYKVKENYGRLAGNIFYLK